MGEITQTSITVSWTIDGGVVNNYMLDWGVGRETLSGSATSYTIDKLEEGQMYTISLTATNAAGNATDKLSASTTAAGGVRLCS